MKKLVGHSSVRGGGGESSGGGGGVERDAFGPKSAACFAPLSLTIFW